MATTNCQLSGHFEIVAFETNGKDQVKFVDRKMEGLYDSKITYCNFPGADATVRYACFQGETCCNEGCCPRPPFAVFKAWYFWLLLVGIIFVCSGGLKYCKVSRRPADLRRRTRFRAVRRTRSDSTADSYVLRDRTIGNVGQPSRVGARRFLGSPGNEEANALAIDRYLACRAGREDASARNEILPPPSYSSLQKTVEQNGSPPQYDVICKTNLQRVEIHKMSPGREANRTTIVRFDRDDSCRANENDDDVQKY